MNRRERRAQERRRHANGNGMSHELPDAESELEGAPATDPAVSLPRLEGAYLRELQTASRTIAAMKTQYFDHMRAAGRLVPHIETHEQRFSARCLEIADELGIVRLPGDILVVDADTGQMFIRRGGQLLTAMPTAEVAS